MIHQKDVTAVMMKMKNVRKYASKICMNILNSSDDEQVALMNGKYCLECIPKRYLKKCFTCGFKKRSCFLKQSSCSAQSKICFSCETRGHFPNSARCNRKKKRSISLQSNITNIEEYSNEALLSPSDSDFMLIDYSSDASINSRNKTQSINESM